MKLREFKFNELKNPLSPVNLCVKDGKRCYEECSIGEIKETRWFFNTLVIELEAMKDGV